MLHSVALQSRGRRHRDHVFDPTVDPPVTRRSKAIVPVVLSGGAGTRLWPMSREQRPKQFLPLVTDLTLFQETLLRTRHLGARVCPPVIVCNSAHRFLVAEQLREIGVRPEAIVLEPTGRNTAPAAAVAALLAQHAEKARGDASTADPDLLMLVLPADHVISDVPAFAAAVDAAIDAAVEGYLVTFGVVPDKPETGYGYLLRGSDRGSWAVLDGFVEKPDLATAKAYLESGRYLWNSGMFLFSAAAFLRELAVYEPTMLSACERAVAEAEVDADFTRLGAAFSDCPSNSIDFAVMEKTKRAAVVPLAAGWSDVGSWPALHRILSKDGNGNVTVGDVLMESCKDSYVTSSGRLVAAIGLDGVIVVETGDAVLVMASERAQDVKRIVDALKAANRTEHTDTEGPRN